MTKRGYAKITNERHHLITPELLARKWGIGLENEKDTLKETTQDYICSYLQPLTRIEGTYLFSQCLRWLSCKLYMNKLFAKQKSIIGSTFYQILTDGEGFVYVHPHAV